MKNVISIVFFIAVATFAEATPKVYFFLQTECPLSQQYVKSVNELYHKYGERYEMVAVFPIPNDDSTAIADFIGKYHLKTPVIRDPDFTLTHAFNATVTPEAVIVNDEGEVLYAGPIDNRVVRLGKYRNVVDVFYVKENLELLSNNEKVRYNRQTPIGCIIDAH